MGDDRHRGRRLRNAGGGHARARLRRRGGGRQHRPARRHARAAHRRARHRALRSRIARAPRYERARARGPLHLGGDGTRHPRGARAGRDPASHPPLTSTLTERSPRAQPNGFAGMSPGRLRFLGYSALAALAYIPMLLTAPGRVVADTKSYLYLDPGRLLERAPSMWDPNIGLGTVTHQNIGYLLPMGPYYWLMHAFGVPAWVSQRLWFGSILLFAALSMLYLFRTLHVRGPGVPSGRW